LNVSLAPPLQSDFQLDFTVRLEHDATGTQQGGYLYARSLVTTQAFTGPQRFFSVYVRPQQRGLRVFYATLMATTQQEVYFPTIIIDDGALHSVTIQVHPLAASEFRGVARAKVVVIVDAMIVQRHVLSAEVADCGGNFFLDCVTYLGGRAVEGASGGLGATTFGVNGCLQQAALQEPSGPLPAINPSFDMLAVGVNVNDVTMQHTTRFGRNDTCILPATAAPFPPQFGPPLTVTDFPVAGPTFSVSVHAILPTLGYGYLFAKSGIGSLRYYSLYVRRNSGHLVFFYKAVGLAAQQRVTLTDFSLSNNTRFEIDLHVVQTTLSVMISSTAGSVASTHTLVGVVDDCETAAADTVPCTLHVGERAGGNFPLRPFGCVSQATLFPDGTGSPTLFA